MQNKALEIFYLFFQGVLTFQVLFFGVVYFITRRKDILYYSLFLFFAAAYFFINAPYTFFGIPEDDVWNAEWYDYFNTPVIIIENLFYLLFLKAFFTDITTDKIVSRIFSFVLWLIPGVSLLFIVLTILHDNKQFIFYTVKLITVIPAVAVALVLFKRKPPFATPVAMGLLCTIIGTSITVFMIILGNNGVHHLFTDGYPLFFIRLGILGDMIFYLIAILKKWHSQEKQLAIEKLESQLAEERLRNKISTELHDDIGSTLSGITMYSYLINDLLDSGKYDQAKQSASIIQRSADEMTNNIGDMVWTIKPDYDTVQKLIEKIEEYAAIMTKARSMQLKVDTIANSTNTFLPVESRRNIYLFCKEAINNAVKYSNGNLVELLIKESGDVWEFSVADNGKGFDILNTNRGNGLENMQKRADYIGAEFNLRSDEKNGTRLSLRYKITQ
jgi:signal transduction histidine kinase